MDTGAAVSIVPQKLFKNLVVEPTPVMLHTATGENITCEGQANLQLSIPLLRRTYSWNFIIANTTTALLGLDFLSNFNLKVDCTKRILVDEETSVSANLIVTSTVNNVIVNKSITILYLIQFVVHWKIILDLLLPTLKRKY